MHVRRAQLKIKFGLTIEQYDELVRQANGVCAICEQPESLKRRLSVDHDHATGELRGLLCNRCNTVLGHIDDDPSLLEKIPKYLRRPPLRK